LPQTDSDEDTGDVRAARSGDESAYARLIARHERVIQIQMFRFTRDPGQCRELVQEVFVTAYLSLGSFRGEAPFLHWLRRIATRTGYRHWTREAKQRHIRAAVIAEPSLLEEAKRSNDGAAALLFSILALLPPKDRMVLTLFYFESCSVTEIADRVGWSATLVRVRLHRSRNRLKKLIESNPAWREAL
jgi:RNA polymerase sigma-70 factor (ECF subfamily)